MVELLFEISGKNSEYLPHQDQPLPAPFDRKELAIPDLNEVQVVRHFTKLSSMNFGVDSGMYPLGSCTMKYNPKINEDVCRLPGFVQAHPLTEDDHVQGCLRLMYELEQNLREITGMDAVSLQPSAGAHGELTGIMIAKAYFESRGEKRRKIIVPDSAHGTNPASAAICGFAVFNLKSNPEGAIDLDSLREAVDGDTVLLMLTNPSTLGLFEENVSEIAEILHEKGALLYCDGANMNAMLGITRPGDQGVDILHLNLHKTFSTPHGGGGPGSGPVGVKRHLEEFLPSPFVEKEAGAFVLRNRGKNSIGRVRAFNGNFGVLVRAYAYIKAHGPSLKKLAESAVLNANYVQENLKADYLLPHNRRCAHECVFSADWQVKNGVHAMDIAKRLLDYGYHSPTIYFPQIVSEALMIEPTESESKESLDAFIGAMKAIALEAQQDPELVKSAPHNTPVGRLDGVLAARKPNLSYPI